MNRKAYLTDLSDEKWTVLAPLIPPAKTGGRPRITDMREVLNAIFTSSAAVEPGGCSLKSFLSGRPSTPTFGTGTTVGVGNRSTRRYTTKSIGPAGSRTQDP